MYIIEFTSVIWNIGRNEDGREGVSEQAGSFQGARSEAHALIRGSAQSCTQRDTYFLFFHSLESWYLAFQIMIQEKQQIRREQRLLGVGMMTVGKRNRDRQTDRSTGLSVKNVLSLSLRVAGFGQGPTLPS